MKAQKIKDWLINNALTIFILVGPGVLGFITTIRAYIKGKLTVFDIIMIGLFFVIILALIAKAIWRRIDYRSYYYPWSKILTGYNYTVSRKEITYIRNKDDTLQFSRNMKIKCCNNRLGFILDKYIWTGENASSIKLNPINGITKIEYKNRIGIWNYYVLELSNHIKKGEEREISYKWMNICNCKSSSPFFSTSTDEPTKEIILVLELGEEYANQEIVCEEFRAIESDYPLSIRKDKLDEHGRYRWEISKHKAKRFRYYRIRWSWVKGQNAMEFYN